MAPGSTHPAWWNWRGRSILVPKTPSWPRIIGKCKRKKLLHWPSHFSGVVYGPEPLQTHSVEQSKSSTSVWLWWWKRVTGLIWKKRSGRGLWKTTTSRASNARKSTIADTWSREAHLLCFNTGWTILYYKPILKYKSKFYFFWVNANYYWPSYHHLYGFVLKTTKPNSQQNYTLVR